MRLIDVDSLGICKAKRELFKIPEYADGWNEALEIIFNTETLSYKDLVPQGEWKRVIPSKSAAKWSTMVSCSVCHARGYGRYNFCPNCGARMTK